VSEKSANKTLGANLTSLGFQMYRVENESVGPGMPDFHFLAPHNESINPVAGWIESKWLPELPKRPTTKVTIEFQKDQPDWIWNHRKNGGRVWISLMIGRGPKAWWMLFDGCYVGRLAGWHGNTWSGLTKSEKPTLGQLVTMDSFFPDPRRTSADLLKDGAQLSWERRAHIIAKATFAPLQREFGQ